MIPDQRNLGGVPAELDAVIGLGSNLGDSLALFREARAMLAKIGRLTASSSLYQGEPIGGPEQPDYYNAAVRLSCGVTAWELLAEALRVEEALGRVRDARWGPRTIDLDVLWIRGLSVHSAGLVVPHCRLHLRRFALVPLLDVAANAADPTTGLRYDDCLLRLVAPPLRMLVQDW